MKRTSPMSIAEIVDKVIKSNNLEEGMLSHRAMTVWSEVVGPVINRHTVERRVYRGVLYVRINSAPVRQELSMQRNLLLDALNTALGRQVLNDIKFM